VLHGTARLAVLVEQAGFVHCVRDVLDRRQ